MNKRKIKIIIHKYFNKKTSKPRTNIRYFSRLNLSEYIKILYL